MSLWVFFCTLLNLNQLLKHKIIKNKIYNNTFINFLKKLIV